MNIKRSIPEFVRSLFIVFILIVIYHYSFIHSLWHIYICIHPQTLVWVSIYSYATSGMGLFLFIHNLYIGLFLLIHNLCHRSLFILQQLLPRGCGWIKRDPYQRLWMNKKRPISEVVDEKRHLCQGLCWIKRDLYQRLWMKKRDLCQRLWMNKKRPSGMGLFLFFHNLWDKSFLFIHNLWFGSLFIHPQPLWYVYFYSSSTSVIGLFFFIHNLWNRSLFIHP
jgi:hypothetical protein